MRERLVAQNAVMEGAASAFAASQGETVQSGPNCQTINDSEPILSYWPGSLALRAADTYNNTAYRQCDFSTSGGRVCKSMFTVSNAQLVAEVDCVTLQQREDRFIVRGQEVHAVTEKDRLWDLSPAPANHRKHRR